MNRFWIKYSLKNIHLHHYDASMNMICWHKTTHLVHSFVKGNVFEYFDPRKEYKNSNDVVKLLLPVAQKFKVWEWFGLLNQIWKKDGMMESRIFMMFLWQNQITPVPYTHTHIHTLWQPKKMKWKPEDKKFSFVWWIHNIKKV